MFISIDPITEFICPIILLYFCVEVICTLLFPKKVQYCA
jgi:hypothetical protein